MNDHIFENNNHDAVSIFLPRIIQIVNLTRVRMLSLKMRYIFTVTAIAGTNGKPGVMNITLFLKQTIKNKQVDKVARKEISSKFIVF